MNFCNLPCEFVLEKKKHNKDISFCPYVNEKGTLETANTHAKSND